MPTASFAIAVISPDRRVRDEVASALNGHNAEALWALGEYPEPRQMAPIREAPAGCVVLLDFSDPLRAKAVAAELDRGCPTAATVAILPNTGAQDLRELMQLGIREVVGLPVSPVEIVRAVTRAGKKLQQITQSAEAGSPVFSFMPAKPGCGATTLAANVAAAAARLANERLLLADFDLRLGMTSFLFKLRGDHSMMDALMFSANLDITRWQGLVCRRGKLDILGSAPAEFGRDIKESGAAEILAFARGVYSAIVADLPGDMRGYELEILQHSNEIFLVCTSEIGALHLARKKAQMLQSLDLGSKVSVIMNRVENRGSMPVTDIEEVLQLPVRFQVGCAEREIQEAAQKGAAMEGRSPVMVQIENIARHVVPAAAPMEQFTGKRRFIDFFSVTPVRDLVNRR